MGLKMTIEEALEFADELSRGLTLHEGSHGWRVVCMLLAEEVRRRHGTDGELVAARCERDSLRAFAQAVMECWPNGDIDGGTLQDAAVAHGLLIPETRHEPCGENCNCAENADAQEFGFGVVCYRKTSLLQPPNG